MGKALPKVTQANYFDPKINKAYFSCSQIKKAARCLAHWKAERDLEFHKPQDPLALILGSYADNALTEDGVTFERYIRDNEDRIFCRGIRAKGKLKAFKDLDASIDHVRQSPGWMEYLDGKTQIIITFEDFLGHPFRCKLDILNSERAFICDLKTTKGIEETFYVPHLNARLPWIQVFGYEMQAALYREAVFQKYQFIPDYYIAAMEKKWPFNHDVFDLITPPEAEDGEPLVKAEDLFPQRLAEAKAVMDRMADAIDTPHYELPRCGKCDYCILNKTVMSPRPVRYDVRGLDF